MSFILDSSGRQITLERLGKDDVSALSGMFLQGLRAHIESITEGLGKMERAVVLRDGLPAFVTRPMLWDYCISVAGAVQALTLALRRAEGVQASEIPQILNGLDYGNIIDHALRLVFGDVSPAGSSKDEPVRAAVS